MADDAAVAKTRETSAHRLIAFSDGVAAIAITLLILPLTEITVGRDTSLGQVIVENGNALLAFALSFWVIANYWTIHHGLFAPVRHQNPRLIALNMLWLAAIVFLPFPTALIADNVGGGFGTLYIGNLLIVSVLSLVIAEYLARHPELTDSRETAESRNQSSQSAAVIVVLVAAGVVSLFFPRTGVLALLLLIPAQAIAGRLDARTSKKATKL
jgi:uncharacterized membrane protein